MKKEKSSLFLHWKNSHQNVHMTQNNLQIQSNPNHIPRSFFTEQEKKKFIWKHKTPCISKAISHKSQRDYKTRLMDTKGLFVIQ